MNKSGWRILKSVLVVVALLDGAFGFWFSDRLTTTRPEAPQGDLTIPWGTHGGTVFISAADQQLLYLAWTVGGVVLATYWIGALLTRNSRKARG